MIALTNMEMPKAIMALTAKELLRPLSHLPWQKKEKDTAGWRND
jgi:hypothetical protein